MRLILSQIQVAGQILAQDDSDEDESGDDNLGLDFFPIFNVSFYFKSQYVYCIINKSLWKLYHCLANSISCIFIPDMWVFELWYTFYLIIENSSAKKYLDRLEINSDKRCSLLDKKIIH